MTMTEEIWKDIPNYEGIYQVSSIGRVKSLYRVVKRGKVGDLPVKEKIRRLYNMPDGYISVNLSKNGTSKSYQLHQLVAMAFLNHTPCGYKLVVNHINLNKSDNRLENLEVITHRENCNQKHIPSLSEHTGVIRGGSNWEARIYLNGKSVYLGSYDNEVDAANSYQKAFNEIKNNQEISWRPRKKSSKYKGVSFYKSRNKWTSFIKIDNKYKHLGYFNTEEEAHEHYKNKIKELQIK